MTNMALAREAANALGFEPRFMIMGMGDGASTYLEPGDAETFVVRSVSLPACWRILGRQDVVLDIGAGDSFADIYAPRRFFYLWITKMMAIWQRTPLLLSPQTIGPFTKPLFKRLASMALNGARVAVARDRASLAALQELSSVRSLLSADVAFALPYSDESRLRGGERLRVGVNVSGLLFADETNRFGLQIDYAHLMRKFISSLLGRGNVDVHLLTHVTTSDAADDDGRVADQLAREFPQAIRVPNFKGPIQAKSFISSLDFLVSGRMHACIGAFSSGTPVVPIAYSRKFEGVFGLLGYEHIIPVTGMSTAEALAYLETSLDRRMDLAADVAKGMAQVSDLIDNYRQELRDLFASTRNG